MKINIYAIILGVLIILVLAYMQFGPHKKPQPLVNTVVRVDTAYLPGDTVYIHDTPKLKSSTPGTIPVSAKPSKNYDSLLSQYAHVVNVLYMLNHYVDTLKYPQGDGFIVLDESVIENKLMGRDVTFNIPTKIITKTIDNTVIQPLHRKVFIGGGIGSTTKLALLYINAGLLYENRRENIVGIHVGLSNAGQVMYSGSAYWKISFRRKN